MTTCLSVFFFFLTLFLSTFSWFILTLLVYPHPPSAGIRSAFYRHPNMDVLKNFLFPKIDLKRDIIPAKIWFPSGKRWLANNMTGQADVRLCKLGDGWWLVKWMYQALFFSLSSQRSKNNPWKQCPISGCHQPNSIDSASYPDLSLEIGAERKAVRGTTGETVLLTKPSVCTLPMVLCGSSPIPRVSRSPLPCEKRSAWGRGCDRFIAKK